MTTLLEARNAMIQEIAENAPACLDPALVLQKDLTNGTSYVPFGWGCADGDPAATSNKPIEEASIYPYINIYLPHFTSHTYESSKEVDVTELSAYWFHKGRVFKDFQHAFFTMRSAVIDSDNYSVDVLQTANGVSTITRWSSNKADLDEISPKGETSHYTIY